MKFSLDRKEFINTLRIGSHFAGKYRALPVLDNVKISIKGEHIIVSSYDNESAITKKSNIIESSEDITFCISPKLLLGALKSLKEDVVNIEVNQKSMNVIIRHKKGELVFPYEDSEQYPSPLKEESDANFEISSERLYAWMSSAMNFVANDTLRPVMNGVYLYFSKDEFGICASDGHRMFTDYIDYNYNESELTESIINAKAIPALLDMINGTEMTNIKIGKINVSFTTDSSKIVCRKIEGRYPNFKSVLPKESNTKVSVDKKEFIESLNRVSLTANTASFLVKFATEGSLLKLSSEDIDFSMKSCDEMFCDKEGNDITIGFKGNFLKMCVDATEGEKVRFEMMDSSRAAMILGEDDSNRKIILMPMMLNS